MSERRYSWKYIVVETKAFVQAHGALSESERDRLDFDLMQGNGDYIPATGGLKRIRCGLGGHRGTSENAWEVVFAEYTYSDIRRRVFVLLDKCPLALRRTLGEQEKKELRQFKERLDDLMGRYYERLQEEDEHEEVDQDDEEDLRNEDDEEEGSDG
jgi:hypothetical protein